MSFERNDVLCLPGAAVGAGHCNQYGHVPGCAGGGVAGGGLRDMRMVAAGLQGRKEAEAALRAVVGKPLSNSRFSITATVSNNSLKKMVSGNALGVSFRNLTDAGVCDKDMAYRIHMTAARELPVLFAGAERREEQAVYHEQGSRETATHLYSFFRVEGFERPFVADITVLGYAGEKDRRLYSIGMRVSLPLPTSGARQEVSPKRSEGGGLDPRAGIKAQRVADVKYKEAVMRGEAAVGRKKRHQASTLNFVTEWVTKKAGRQGLAPSTAPQGSSPDGGIKAQRAADVKGDVEGVAAGGYTAAVDRFQGLETARASEWEQLEPGARAGKFFLAAVEDERLLEGLRELLDECLEEGCSEGEFVHRASGLLGVLVNPETGRPYYDPEWRQGLPYEQRLAYDRDVRNVDSAARLRLIFRTQWELGAGYAEWERAREPGRLERFPGWRFVRQPGAKTKREDHVEHENEVRLVSDIDYWLARNRPEIGGFNQPHGPWGYNSWMRVEPVSRAECERLGLLAPGEVVVMPPEAAQWDLRAAIEQSNTASLDGLSPEGVQVVMERCREQGISLVEVEVEREAPARDGGDEGVLLPVGDGLERELELLLEELEGVEDEWERELLDLIDELAEWQDDWEKARGCRMWEEWQPAAAGHCNQYRHVPGCAKGGEGKKDAGLAEAPQYALAPKGKEGRRYAEKALYEVAGRAVFNNHFKITATISRESVGKITSGNALGETFRALHDSGFCDKDTAYQIHMTAAAHLHELFAEARKKDDQAVYHKEEHRETATHLYSLFSVKGYEAPLTADISVIGFKGDANRRIYSLGVRVRPPLPTSGISQKD